MAEICSNVPHIEVKIDEKDIKNGSLQILKILRDDWLTVDIKFKLLTDGLTNTLIKCLPATGFPESDAVLIRVYGNNTDLLIDRKVEKRNLVLLNKYNLAPTLYATFDNGLVYEYVPGETLNCNNVTDRKIYRLVAKKMAELHKVKVDVEENHEPFIWRKMKPFLDLIPEVFSDQVKNQRREQILPSKHEIESELQYMRSILKKIDSPLVFCHNDLLLGNVIYTESNNSVTFIDYEYAALNYQAFDIGNHFAEFVGCNLNDLDYSRYPKKELQIDWLAAYLTEFLGRAPNTEEVEELYVQSNLFFLFALVFWALWGLIQAEHSSIDYDFLGYSATRIKEYFNKKEEILSQMTLASSQK